MFAFPDAFKYVFEGVVLLTSAEPENIALF